jgi:1-acyl-sn-glycerol-3-phosphate acyltransferase
VRSLAGETHRLRAVATGGIVVAFFDMAAMVGHRPTTTDIALMRLALAPWRWVTAPRVSGVEHLPVDRPALLAGNHTTLALLDSPLLLLEIHAARGVFPRTLGDHLHFRLPGWRSLVERFGVVDGTPETLRALMRAGEWVVVFPGGAHEVFKRRGEKYALLWDGRTGFARAAIEGGYPIVPFSLVGAEDMLDVVLDADDLLASRLGPLVRRLAPRADLVPPIVRGIGPSMMPRAERLYFRFGAPIETRHLAGREHDQRAAFAIGERVRHAVEEGIAQLLLERERDPDRALLARLLAPHAPAPRETRRFERVA